METTPVFKQQDCVGLGFLREMQGTWASFSVVPLKFRCQSTSAKEVGNQLIRILINVSMPILPSLISNAGSPA